MDNLSKNSFEPHSNPKDSPSGLPSKPPPKPLPKRPEAKANSVISEIITPSASPSTEIKIVSKERALNFRKSINFLEYITAPPKKFFSFLANLVREEIYETKLLVSDKNFTHTEVKTTADKCIEKILLKNSKGQNIKRLLKSYDALLTTISHDKELSKYCTLQKEVLDWILSRGTVPEGNFVEVMKTVCKEFVTDPSWIEKEVQLYDNEKQAILHMLHRAKIYHTISITDISLASQMQKTGYSLSIVQQIDDLFQKQIRENGAPMRKSIENVTVLVSKNNVVIEGKQLGEGSFKSATLAKAYFSAPQGVPSEFVLVQPKQKIVQDPKQPDQMNKNPVLSEKGFSNYVEDQAVEVERDSDTRVVKNASDEDSGTRVVKNASDEDSGTRIVKNASDEDNGTRVVKDTMEENSSTTNFSSVAYSSVQFSPDSNSSELNETVAARDIGKEVKVKEKYVPEFLKEKAEVKVTEKNFLELPLVKIKEKISELSAESNDKFLGELKKRAEVLEKEAEILNKYTVLDEKKSYEEEVKIALTLQGEGVVKIHKVVNLSGEDSSVMIQEVGGYHLPKNDKRDEATVIDLNKMRKLYKKNLLTKEETVLMKNMFLEGFLAVNRMHTEYGYIHRDLKEENFLISKDGHGILSDFGTVVSEGVDPKKAEYQGTPNYSAPELCKHTINLKYGWSAITAKSDVWSAGMMLQNVFLNGVEEHPLIKKIGDFQTIVFLQKIGSYGFEIAEKEKEYLQMYPEPADKKSLEHLIWQSTRLNPEERPTMEEFCTLFKEAAFKESEK